jgi:hypothetical protein
MGKIGEPVFVACQWHVERIDKYQAHLKVTFRP